MALAVTLIVVCAAANDTAAAVADAAPQFIWSGEDAKGSPEWSLGANWAGGVAPSAAGPVALEFPRLTGSACGTCYSGKDDVGGLTAESMRIDDGDEYRLEGDALRLGAGGLTASPASGSSGEAGDVFSMPLELTAAQSWSISGHGLGGSGENGVLLTDGVSGAGDALTVGLNQDAALVLEGDSEVGTFTADGSPSTFVLLDGELNAGDGSDVVLSGVPLIASGRMGPLRSSGSVVPFPSIEAASATLSSELVLTIAERGDVAGADYSILSAQSTVDLQSPLLAVEAVTKGCEPFPVGRTYTILSTSGALEGSFSNAAEGARVPIVTVEKCLVKQLLKIAYHRSGSTRSVVGTVVEELEPPAEPENKPIPYEVTIAPWIVEGAARDAEEQTRRYEEEQRRKKEEAKAWENAQTTPPAQQTTASITTPARVRLRSARLEISRAGRLAVRLGCNGHGRCRGSLRLTVAARAPRDRGGRALARWRTIATRRFSIAAGKTGVVTLSLDPYGRSLARSDRGGLGGLQMRLGVIQSAPPPRRSFTRSVKLSASGAGGTVRAGR